MIDPMTDTQSEPQPVTLHQFPEKVAVVQLAAGADIPTWAESSSIFSITATASETSLVCAGRSIPTKVRATRGLVAFSVADAGDNTVAGVLVSLLEPLADELISVFTLSTYQTNWILLPATDVDRAAEAWRRRGHTVTDAPVPG